jgi:hypothetical protein
MCGGEPETQAGPALSFCGPGRGSVEGLLFASTHDLGNYWQRPSLLHLSGAPGFQGPVRPPTTPPQGRLWAQARCRSGLMGQGLSLGLDRVSQQAAKPDQVVSLDGSNCTAHIFTLAIS